MIMEKLKSALRLDLVLTLWQAERLTGWPPELVLHYAHQAGMRIVVRELGLTRNSRPQSVTFLCCDQKVATYDGDLLRQLAGTAAMRLLCQAPWSEWTVLAHQGGIQISPGVWAAVPVPDAVWARWDDGQLTQWWIEYDVGSHVHSVLAVRMQTYARPASYGDVPRPQMWGAATRERTEFLMGVARAALPPSAICVVRTVDWTSPRPHRGPGGQRLRIQSEAVTP
ncbi:hypothetical protein [Deinococcus marmoris]|uniref:hypothetical protein n=1 Tax=Deinococcus marmoris TaxID=249408 RepID=UPI0004964751|nr:hypothetical protein [Deinococcus marmoris]